MSGRAVAPASSANLGSGFDSVALALDLRLTVEVERDDVWAVTSDGEDPGPEATRFVAVAAGRALGDDRSYDVHVESAIPRAAGLGSSAALAAAGGIGGAPAGPGRPVDPQELFEIVADVEGHGDNAAAAVHGGLVAVADGHMIRLDLSPHLHPVVAVPRHELATVESRRALPDEVPHDVAARSVARAVALVEGLRRADAEVLAAASGDELHEPFRMALAPEAAAVMEAAATAGADLAALSGAGPSVLALVQGSRRSAVVAAMRRALGPEGDVLTPPVAVAGAG